MGRSRQGKRLLSGFGLEFVGGFDSGRVLLLRLRIEAGLLREGGCGYKGPLSLLAEKLPMLTENTSSLLPDNQCSRDSHRSALFAENFPDTTQGLGCDLLRIALDSINTRVLCEQGR